MRPIVVVLGITLLVAAAVFVPCLLQAGEVTTTPGYSLLSPIRSGNLTVFPVVAIKSYDTAEFLTLDEGLRSGDVVVTEAGQAQGLIRHRQVSRRTLNRFEARKSIISFSLITRSGHCYCLRAR